MNTSRLPRRVVSVHGMRTLLSYQEGVGKRVQPIEHFYVFINKSYYVSNSICYNKTPLGCWFTNEFYKVLILGSFNCQRHTI